MKQLPADGQYNLLPPRHQDTKFFRDFVPARCSASARKRVFVAQFKV
jgi:hypothetical protein